MVVLVGANYWGEVNEVLFFEWQVLNKTSYFLPVRGGSVEYSYNPTNHCILIALVIYILIVHWSVRIPWPEKAGG